MKRGTYTQSQKLLECGQLLSVHDCPGVSTNSPKCHYTNYIPLSRLMCVTCSHEDTNSGRQVSSLSFPIFMWGGGGGGGGGGVRNRWEWEGGRQREGEGGRGRESI